MIDWSKLKWTKNELAGVNRIEIHPRVMGDKIVLQVNWLDPSNHIVRQDVHVEVLELPPLAGEAGAFE